MRGAPGESPGAEAAGGAMSGEAGRKSTGESERVRDAPRGERRRGTGDVSGGPRGGPHRESGHASGGPRGDPRRGTAGTPGASGIPVIAVDTGGTFTDLLLLDAGALTALKVPSTPADPAAAVLRGIDELLGPARPRAPFVLIHGSTVGTNAVLERKGARVFLVTNRGFEDVIEIGRQDRPQLYALVGSRPPPPVARSDRIGIGGRIGPAGEEVTSLEPGELEGLADRLRDADAVAVSLLHSYANPAHEEAVALALEGIGVPLSVSSRLLPEFREYERTSTTVVNAYVAPRMEGYLRRLERESGAEVVRIMGSAGGVLPLERAVAEPVHTVLSGPAGGVAGALARGGAAGFERLLAFDMGGTSTDVALLPGRLLHTREGGVGGMPVAIPLLDIHTVGAGGGSIARIDPGGALRVGPESAGAEPGPICYGRGGTEVTVTDAHVRLGRLPADAFLGGARTLDRDAIDGPLGRLADAMGTSPERAAEGIVDVANATMERALRVISVERGMDPADFHLFAFGGAGGLHAVELAERLGAAGVLVPPDPGLASAWGMLAAPIVRDRTRTLLVASDDEGAHAAVHRGLDELEARARAELAREGFADAALACRREVDARYRGQSWELTVAATEWVEAFHALHEERYGYRRAERPVEAVTVRVRLEAPGMRPPSASGGGLSGTGPSAAGTHAAGAPEAGPSGSAVRVHAGGGELTAERIARRDLPPSRGLTGPAVISDYSATVWCPPGWRATARSDGLLHLERIS